LTFNESPIQPTIASREALGIAFTESRHEEPTGGAS